MNYFEHNLKVLAARQPELVEMIQGPMDTSHIQVLPSEAGSPTAEVAGADGKRIIVHDRHDPRARAREHVSTFDLSGNNGSVLLGFGLGYLALEMVEAMDEGHLLIICESDPALFKVAMSEVDREPVLRTRRVKILLGKDIDIAAHIVTMAIKLLTSKISVIRFHPAFALDPATDNLLEKQARDVMTRNPKCIHRDAMAAHALKIMEEFSITSLFVIEESTDRQPVGLIHIHDLLKAKIV